MGSNNDNSRGKTFLSGALAGTLTGVLLQPLDVIKTTQQAHRHQSGRAAGPFATASTVVKVDGAAGLWKGLVRHEDNTLTPTAVRVFCGAGIYFSTLTFLMPGHDRRSVEGTSAPPWRSFLAGASARTLAASVLSPIAVIKTRMEFAKRGDPAYRSVTRALVHLAQREGVGGLFSGLLPTVLRDAPFSGLYFMFFDALKRHTQPWLPENAATPIRMGHTFLAGLHAGAAATLITHPFDVIKTRLQVRLAETAAAAANRGGSAGEHEHVRPSTVSAAHPRAIVLEARAILEHEGVTTLWRGAWARVTKRALSTAITWVLFEQAMREVS